MLMLHVQLHIDRVPEHDDSFQTTVQARKLMHRFREAEVELAMDEVAEKGSAS